MEKLPAGTGWLWIKQGFALYRKQPGALTLLFLLYAMLNLLLGVIPLLGQVAAVVLIPVFSVAFMQACAHIDQGKRVMPALLSTGFQKPAFPNLLALGLLYLVVATLAIGLSALVDQGAFLKLMTGQLEPNSREAREANLGGAFLLTMLICLPAAMGFCFSAPLIYWQRMSIGKAIFFSFFSVLRTLKSFIVFALSLFGLTILSSQLVLLLFGRSEIAFTMLMPLSMLLSVLMHCSFYASYRQIFGVPGAAQDASSAPEAE
ncbi:MAG: BPSS1780 family membrane protein [Pseudomonadota bacterium]